MATSRQIIAANQWMDAISHNRPVAKSKILQLSGYSRKIQRNPQRVFLALGFQARINATLPIDEVVRAHRELLDEDDPGIVSRAIELGYRLHGFL